MGSKTTSSLIAVAERQTELPAAVFSALEKRGEYTAERLFSKRPDTYRAIVTLSGQKMGQIAIGKALRVSPNTVRAVQVREGVSIDIEKERIADLAMHGATLAIEGIVEDLSDPKRRRKVSTRDKAIVSAVLIDKGALLRGEATQRVEVLQAEPEHDDFNSYLARLKDAAMHSSGGSLPQKGGAAALGTEAAGLAATGVPGAVIDVGADKQSGADNQ